MCSQMRTSFRTTKQPSGESDWILLSPLNSTSDNSTGKNQHQSYRRPSYGMRAPNGRSGHSMYSLEAVSLSVLAFAVVSFVRGQDVNDKEYVITPVQDVKEPISLK